ncbi:MAG: thioredoxin fold domain-containing protein [Lentisphaerota bacterium]
MRKSIAILAVVLSATLSYAADLTWMDNFSDAEAKAAKDNKYIFADFTGSDWCPWCIKLDAEVLNTPEFKEYAKDNLILFKADFPRNKQISDKVKDQNVRLMDKYSVMGFPTILIIDQEGGVVATMGYEQGGPVPYIASIKKAISTYKPVYKTKAQKSLDELRDMTGDSQLAADKSDGPDTVGFFDNMFKQNN